MVIAENFHKLGDFKQSISKKELFQGPSENARKDAYKYFPKQKHGRHQNLLYGILCLVYDGTNSARKVKEELRNLFIAGMMQPVVTPRDIDMHLRQGIKLGLLERQDDALSLTPKGRRIVRIEYHLRIHETFWMSRLLSESAVMIATFACLVILSSLKIFIGLSLQSQGMLTEGLENLTDLVKIVIIFLSLKLGKDRAASIIIILLMLGTGISMVYTGIEALFLTQNVITPTIEAYIIGLLSIGLNAMLMYLKGLVGRASGNLTILSDSKDSELNIRISIGVLIGLTFAIFKVYFVDAIIGIIIAILVFKEGGEVLVEMIRKKDEFDIQTFKVKSDDIYDNSLTKYFIASIQREGMSQDQLLDNFEAGLTLGRRYYHGFADFFYTGLGRKVAESNLKKLVDGCYFELEGDGKMELTDKGIAEFYRTKFKEYKRKTTFVMSKREIAKRVLGLLIAIGIILLLIFAQDINQWLATI